MNVNEPSRALRLWREWRGFVAFVAVMLVFRSAVADWNHVPSGSMEPSILVGDRIVVDKLAYGLRVPFTHLRLASWNAPHRGDVVTFTSPEDGRLMVKRVIAVPGDRVSMHRNHLTVNGVSARYAPVADTRVPIAVPEGFVLYRESLLGSERVVMVREDQAATFAGSFRTVVVPEGQYLMLGDNRDRSRDSRMIGFVPREYVLGRARSVAFSLDYENYYAPRMNRFLADLP
jgi:signal peptidase I|tara:strand:- start:6241 stop:6933 length:693 start_codon:yes stop_codon:yes gene_type:complete